MRQPCKGCPFNDGLTLEATQGQNYGCLPTAHEMLERLKGGVALSCHETDTEVCRGLAAAADTSSSKLLPHSEWYHGPQKVEHASDPQCP